MHEAAARARRKSRAGGGGGLYHPGPPIADEATLAGGGRGACAPKDPEFVGRLLAVGGPPPLRRREPGFAGLAAIIVSQQVSVASASAIFGRLEARLTPLEAARLAAASDEELRGCGLSSPKIRALRAAAQTIAEGAPRSRGPVGARRRRTRIARLSR